MEDLKTLEHKFTERLVVAKSVNSYMFRPLLHNFMKEDAEFNKPVIAKVVNANKKVFIELFIKTLYNFFGEDYVEVKEEGFIIHFPKVDMTNSYGMKWTIHDLFVKLIIHPTVNDLFYQSLYGRRMSLTPLEAVHGYRHSHLQATVDITEGSESLDDEDSLQEMEDILSEFSQFCLGSSPIANMINNINNAFNKNISLEKMEVLFQGFIMALIDYVSWESIEGGPYILVSEVIQYAVHVDNASENFGIDIERLIAEFDGDVLEAISFNNFNASLSNNIVSLTKAFIDYLETKLDKSCTLKHKPSLGNVTKITTLKANIDDRLNDYGLTFKGSYFPLHSEVDQEDFMPSDLEKNQNFIKKINNNELDYVKKSILRFIERKREEELRASMVSQYQTRAFTSLGKRLGREDTLLALEG